jgi:uncharacterized protein (TIGR02246 family)
MNTPSLMAPLVALAGVAAIPAEAAPVPPRDVAEVQLRALNHRVVDAIATAKGALLEALTGSDFLHTGSDGVWRTRAEFLAQVPRPAAWDGASYRDLRVRLYGPVAVLHGVIEGLQSGARVARLRYTDVYTWNGAVWRLVGGQHTALRDGVPVHLQGGTAPPLGRWGGQDPTGDDVEALRILNENYVRAFREADVAWYDAHLAPDYVVVSGDGSLQDRAGALADFARPTFATSIRSFPVDKVTIRRFDDVALIHAENAYALKDGRTGVSRYVDLWHKADGRWRCIAAHITVHKAPAL